MAFIAPTPKLYFVDNNGNPLVGGKLYTFESGTETPLATYTDSTEGSENTNPIILNSRGEASVWLQVTKKYTFDLRDANDVPIWTQDGIGTNSGSIQIDVTDFPGVDPTGATDSTSGIQAAIDYCETLFPNGDFVRPILYFPPGIYKTSSALVNEKRPIYIVGSKAYIWNWTSQCITIGSASNPGPENLLPTIVEDLTLYGFTDLPTNGHSGYSGQNINSGFVVKDQALCVTKNLTVWGFNKGYDNQGGLVLHNHNINLRNNVYAIYGAPGSVSASNLVMFDFGFISENKYICYANGGQYAFYNVDCESNNPTNAANITLWEFQVLSGNGADNCLVMNNVHGERNYCQTEMLLNFATATKKASITNSAFLGPPSGSSTYGIRCLNGIVSLDQVTSYNSAAALQVETGAIVSAKDCNFQNFGGIATQVRRDEWNTFSIGFDPTSSAVGAVAVNAPVNNQVTYAKGDTLQHSYYDAAGTRMGYTGFTKSTEAYTLIDAAIPYNVYINGSARLRVTTAAIGPGVDNSLTAGTSGLRYTTVYATNATINTSDETLKHFEDVSDAERQAALELKKLFKKFRWKNDRDQRWHFGVSAQKCIEVLTDHGLDWKDYWFIHKDVDTGLLSVAYQELTNFIAVNS